ncbi:MAG: SurA N-terminal domain-containing protein [Candidatus Tectomicrobia bacterium]|nr:SurA N-terminal domain-containing protein [Candidatus Tectomicrobia bacterium]
MLTYLRKNAQSWMIKTILWALVAAFVGTIFLVWGRGTETGKQNVVATVQGEPISSREYQEAYTTLLENYRQFYGRNLNNELLRSLNLGRLALDQLIERRLVGSEAFRLGLRVSDRDVSLRVQSLPFFQSSGRFDTQRYDTFLRTRGMRPQQFEQLVRGEILQNRYRDLVTQAVTLTDDEVAETYRQENEKVEIAYVRVRGSRFQDVVEVTQEEMAKYYNEHAAEFREPEKRRVEYLSLLYAAYEPKTIADDQVAAYYREHQDEFLDSEQKEREVRARHVLIKLKPNASQEERQAARRKADETRQKALAGEDFAKLARENSEDATAAKGGDLGFFSRGAMVKSFADAAFALKPGEISEVVESEFGSHVIKVEEVREPQVKPLETVRADIAAKLRREEAKRLASETARKVLREDLEGLGFAALAKRFAVKHETPPAFARTGPIPGLPPRVMASVAKATFELDANKFSEAVETESGLFFLHLVELLPSYVPKLQEVIAKVKQHLVRDKGKAQAERVARTLLELIEKTPLTFDLVAASDAYKPERPAPFTHHAGIPGIGRSSELITQAFANQPGYVGVFSSADSAFLFRVEKRIPVDEKKFAEERRQFAADLEARKRSRFFATWLGQLRQATQVQVNEALLF